jgi:Ni,Fe-hydrogenase I large subunit
VCCQRALPFQSALINRRWRTAARGLESKVIADSMQGWYDALIATKQPLEILRTVHSFDPCIACAIHVTDPQGEELVQVKVS